MRLVAFGGPTLIAGTATFSLSPLRAALLGVLATAAGDGLSPARVIELLWRPGPAGRLKHRINQLIYALNRDFPGKLVVRERHRLYLSRGIATDYQLFEKAISNHQWMEAAEFLRRGFLSELTRPPSEAFSEWLDRTRLELRARIREAAAEEWTRLTGRRRWKGAVEPARALLSLDAYDERALRMLIRAEAMAGSVREAEAAFHSFVERSESGSRDWVPQAETLSLVDDIRDLPRRASATFAAPGLDRAPLIGRSEELAELSAAMLPESGGGLRLIVLRGEYGTGKTRLIRESLNTDRLSGIRALRCRPSRTGRRSILSSFLNALASSDIGADLAALAEPWRTTMLELLSERPAATRPPSEPPAVDLGQVDRRYFEAIRQLLVLVAGKGPVILVIDDFHQVEADSAAGLRYVVRRWPSLPLALTLAIGTESVRDQDPINQLLGDLPLQREPTEFTLGALTREAAAELVDTVVDGRIEQRVTDRIVALSDGNPFFLLRLAELSLAGQRLPNSDPDDFVPVPRCISDVFSGRLAELDDDTERTLQLLCVMGHPVHVGTLSKLTDRSRDSCAAALDKLQQARLVRRSPRGFVVRYQLIRHTVYDQIRAARRVWAHRRAASHLDTANTTATHAELAMHYRHAGVPTKALRHALIGAGAAEQSGALREASKLFALARRNILDPRTHARMAERLARLHYMRRDGEDGPARLAGAALELRKVQFHQSALIADIQRLDLLAGSGSCSPQEAAARLRELGRTAEQARHWQAAARAIDLELHIHRREGQGHEADTLAAHARELLEVEPAANGCLHASLALHHQGNFEEGLRHARAAIEFARRQQAPDELLRALVRLVAIHGARGLITDNEAVSAVEEGETLAGSRDDFVEHYNLLASAGTGYRAIGRLDQARNWFARAGRVLANVRTWESHVALECKLGELELEMRELDRSAAHFARARQLWTPGMGRYLEIISHSGAGLTALRLGDMSVAREMASQVPEPPTSWFEDPWVFAVFKAHLCEWRSGLSDGVDAVNAIANLIQTSQPAHWARLKFEEALLRLRHSLPQREEIAQTAAEAAANLGIDRWVRLLETARERARWREVAR